jgi:hypothetical protein
MIDHKLPLLYLFERAPEIERQQGFVLAGLLAIDPIITRILGEADLQKATMRVIFSLLKMLQDDELLLQTTAWMKGTAPPGDFTDEQVFAIRAWSIKATQFNVRVDDLGRVTLQ